LGIGAAATPQIGAAAGRPAADDDPMQRNLIRACLAALSLLLVLAGAALAAKEVVRSGNLALTDDGGIAPFKLPAHGGAPATARLEAEIATLDGTQPPALQTVDLEVSKTIGVDAVGLPVCRMNQVVATSSRAAKRACADALIGSGSAEVEVSFPEQAPFSSTGPLLLFNAGVQGKTTKVLLHAYVDVPAPTAIVVPAQITRIHRGGYGLEITARIPKIAGGAGSVTSFRLDVGRNFTYRGRPHSFLTASCPTGHWGTRGEAGFSDGTRLRVLHVFSCATAR
jgi:hypothetical protein